MLLESMELVASESDSESDTEQSFIDEGMLSGWGSKKNKEALTYKAIVLKSIDDCRKEGSKQMTKGIEIMMKDKTSGQWIPRQLEDQRKVYERNVTQLKILLKYYFDEDYKKNIKLIESNIRNAHGKFIEKYLTIERHIPHKTWTIKTKQFHPHSEIAPMINQEKEDYILEQYQTMHEELILLFKRKNELSNIRRLPAY